MIILRQRNFSKAGEIWAGTKRAAKYGAKGALIGGILAPGNLLALGSGHKKISAGITGAGALVGAGLGAKVGYEDGVHEYKYKNDPKYREKVEKENKALLEKALKSSKNSDLGYISDFDIKSWENLKKEINFPDEFLKYVKFYKNVWSKKLDLWYSKGNPKEIYDIVEFKEMFPIPIDAGRAKKWYEDDMIYLATGNDAGDDGFLCYDINSKTYGWDGPGKYKSLKDILLSNLDKDWIEITKEQEKLVNEFKNKIKSL